MYPCTLAASSSLGLPSPSVRLPLLPQTEIRNFLQTVYKVGVEKVHTINYEGKKKRAKNSFYRRPDYKKARLAKASPAHLTPSLI